MNEQLVIRAAEKDDFLEWKPLWDGYNAFYGRSGETALAPEITHMTWSRFFDAHEPMHALVAERSGKLLGLAHFLYHRNTIQIMPACYLQDLFTADGARGLGVGRALINAVCEQARAAGVPRVYWQTRETNVTAMQLYDKVAEKPGFVIYHKML
ncbi:GNAT family N-acetyltransferase [Janthinobacterium fluminis]|uniref:GNAT family N-acetyltransferase n=1 Tax=Janthinobacterium fluminis TaxID=2987524 RepID=A0ABT5K652_9BURK|nr:GNAT family N-acetyltransferase [Janthinobacterium fluminis]MDC8760486.1 GNAT family N-acetyltransferase [Janthinobacterium fluminis]